MSDKPTQPDEWMTMCAQMWQVKRALRKRASLAQSYWQGFDELARRLLRQIARDSGGVLPLTPANRFKAGAKITTQAWGSLLRPYLSLDANIVLDQNRIDLYEEATGGYTLYTAGLGCELLASGERIRIDGEDLEPAALSGRQVEIAHRNTSTDSLSSSKSSVKFQLSTRLDSR